MNIWFNFILFDFLKAYVCIHWVYFSFFKVINVLILVTIHVNVLQEISDSSIRNLSTLRH